MKKEVTAIIVGSTGLVGSQLLKLTLNDDRFSKVKVFVRKKTNISHFKIEEHIVNFDNIPEWSDLIKGDVLFSAMGTTLKKAGSKEAQYKVDFTFQYEIAKFAASNGVKDFLLVSAMGVSKSSLFFYSKMKAELEEAVGKLKFESIKIFRPGILAGERNEKRIGEKIALNLIFAINKIGLFKSYKPIFGDELASSMINSYFRIDNKSVKIFELKEIFELV